MLTRREFLVSSLATGALAATLSPKSLLAAENAANKVTLFHTNDTHSRIDPFPEGEYKGQGGVARRAKLLSDARLANPNSLLLDAGDIFQGTPYFNQFGGKVEFEAMSAMKYDLATLGNHDFDRGTEGLCEMLPYAKFDFVSSNLEITDATLKTRVKPYDIRTVAGRRLGFFGLCVSCDGLIAEKNHKGVKWLDPVESAQRAIRSLRAEGVDAIIAITHLGLGYTGSTTSTPSKMSDFQLAQLVSGIDVIVGGHSHTLMENALEVTHMDGHKTTIVQAGHDGLWLGKVDLHFKGNQLAQVKTAIANVA